MVTNIQKLSYYHRNRDTILQRSKDYYENNKEKRKEDRRNKYNSMSNEERLKILAYRKEWHHKLDEEKKNKMRKDARDRYYAIKVC